MIILVLLLVLSAVGFAVGYSQKNEALIAISALVLFVTLVGGAMIVFRMSMIHNSAPVLPRGNPMDL